MNEHKLSKVQLLIRTPYALVLILIMAMNIILYFLKYADLSSLIYPFYDLIEWGGNLAVYSLKSEPWRLVTSLFLHVNVIHLVANVIFLAFIGPLVGERFGVMGFVTIYFLGGIAASLSSAWWEITSYPFSIITVSGLSTSVGASGAVMALVGAFCAYLFRAHFINRVDDPTVKKLSFAMLQILVLNIALGYFVDVIDQAAHLGGLLAGVCLGLVLGMTDINAKKTLYIRALAVTGIGLAALFALMKVIPNDELIQLSDQQVKEKIAATEKRQRALRKATLIGKHRGSMSTPVLFEEAMGDVVNIDRLVSDMAFSKDEKTAFFYNHADNTVIVFDLASKEIVKSIRPQPPTSLYAQCSDSDNCYPYAGNFNITLFDNDRKAIVTSMVKNGITILDLQEGELIHTIETGPLPGGILLGSSERYAYVSDSDDDTVSKIDLKEGNVVKQFSWVSGGEPENDYLGEIGLWFGDDEEVIYVYSSLYKKIKAINPDDMSLISEERSDIHYQYLSPVDDKTMFSIDIDGDISLLDRNSRLLQSYSTLCGDINFLAVDLHQKESLRIATVEGAGFRRSISLVRVTQLDTDITTGSYPVEGKIVDLEYSQDPNKLYVLTYDGFFITLDLKKRAGHVEGVKVDLHKGAGKFVDRQLFQCRN